MSIVPVRWCGVCNSRPAAGTLTCENNRGEIFDLPACKECVSDMMKGFEINELEGFHP